MKKLHVKTDDTGRVAAASFDYALGEGETVLTAPEGFAMENAHDWRVAGGALACDPLPTPEAPTDPLDALRAENALLKAQVQALSERGEFVEDCLAEMAMAVYQ